jgi:hypothetical protein
VTPGARTGLTEAMRTYLIEYHLAGADPGGLTVSGLQALVQRGLITPAHSGWKLTDSGRRTARWALRQNMSLALRKEEFARLRRIEAAAREWAVDRLRDGQPVTQRLLDALGLAKEDDS